MPGLATEWSSNEDGTVWTFTLREGVTFQDGTPFNAEAVKFNIDRWNDPNFEFGFRDEGVQYEAWGYVFGGFLGDEAAIVTEANAVDEYTLELSSLIRWASCLPPSPRRTSAFNSPQRFRRLEPTTGRPLSARSVQALSVLRMGRRYSQVSLDALRGLLG